MGGAERCVVVFARVVGDASGRAAMVDRSVAAMELMGREGEGGGRRAVVMLTAACLLLLVFWCRMIPPDFQFLKTKCFKKRHVQAVKIILFWSYAPS